MNVFTVKVVTVAALVAMMIIRAPHIRRSTRVNVEASRRSRFDDLLVALVSLGLALPLAWIATPLLSFADRSSSSGVFAAGVAVLGLAFWLLHRSHVDLGTNWSNTLELRAGHRLITGGVYRRMRHPMYTALLSYGLGLALVIPNWIAGPAFLAAFAVLVAGRIGSEERMMRERFGDEYTLYSARTPRLIPSIG